MQNMEIDLSPINFFSHHQCRVVIKVSVGFHQLHSLYSFLLWITKKSDLSFLNLEDQYTRQKIWCLHHGEFHFVK